MVSMKLLYLNFHPPCAPPDNGLHEVHEASLFKLSPPLRSTRHMVSMKLLYLNFPPWVLHSCDPARARSSRTSLSSDFNSRNERFYFACSCDPARVLAIFGHKSLFSLEFTSKNGRSYFACSCDLARVVAIFSHKSLFSLDFTRNVSTSRVVAIFAHKSLFSLDFTSKMDVSSSRVVAILRVYLRSSGTCLCFHWVLLVKMNVSTSRVVAILRV